MALAPRIQPKMPEWGPWRAKFIPVTVNISRGVGEPTEGSCVLDERETAPPAGTIIDLGSLVNGAESLAVVSARSNDGRRFSFTTSAQVQGRVLLPD